MTIRGRYHQEGKRPSKTRHKARQIVNSKTEIKNILKHHKLTDKTFVTYQFTYQQRIQL